MITIKKVDGRWNVYDDGYLVVSFYSRDAAEATKNMLLDEREYEKSRKEEIAFARYGGAQ